jgi:hypothetical protein
VQITLLPQQSQAIRSNKRYIIACCGTGGGKTFFGPAWLATKIKQFPKELWIVAAPTYDILTAATIPELVKQWQGTVLEGQLKNNPMAGGLQYMLPDGGIIYFRSTGSPQSMQGIRARGIWLDEGGLCSESGWRTIEQRTTFKEGQILLTTTPYAEFQWLEELVKKIHQGLLPDYEYINWKSLDNPYFPAKEYWQKKAEWPRWLFAQRYDGVFGRPEGCVYPMYETAIIPPMTLPVGRKVGGADFGYRDPFVCLDAIQYSHGGIDNLYVYHETYAPSMDISSILDTLDRTTEYFADPSRPDTINEFNKAGFRTLGANNDVLTGILLLTKRFNTKTIQISNECKHLIDDLQLYAYAPGKVGPAAEKPMHEHSHACDALRYLCTGVDTSIDIGRILSNLSAGKAFVGG